MVDVKLTHEGAGFFRLEIGEGMTLLIDPVYTRLERERRVKLRELPKADFVLLTEGMADRFEDLLDILEGSEATLVADPVLCDEVARELDLAAARFMDLGEFESARCGRFRVTAFPIEVPARHGGSLLGAIPTPAFVQEAGSRFVGGEPMAMMRRLPLVGSLGGMFMQQAFGAQRRNATGYRIEIEGGPTVVFLSSSLVESPDLRLLDELAEEGDTDVVLAAVDGESTEGLIWASRELEPETMLLYRREDPWALGRGRHSVPVRRYIDALEEDAEGIEVRHLRDEESWSPKPARPVAAEDKSKNLKVPA